MLFCLVLWTSSKFIIILFSLLFCLYAILFLVLCNSSKFYYYSLFITILIIFIFPIVTSDLGCKYSILTEYTY
ncbi:putative serine/arginine repetitive matrix protein 1 [Iris pallida]|uniref:Serine/arginine repetitive matrix protein 1 n=1 Tax=Iris pallida TaxID=29817 RepID=A0AAX6DW67_IRIPA|nr:putative serine/arginine repetitive matrix protein 1 [Iris pallida]